MLLLVQGPFRTLVTVSIPLKLTLQRRVLGQQHRQSQQEQGIMIDLRLLPLLNRSLAKQLKCKHLCQTRACQLLAQPKQEGGVTRKNLQEHHKSLGILHILLKLRRMNIREIVPNGALFDLSSSAARDKACASELDHTRRNPLNQLCFLPTPLTFPPSSLILASVASISTLPTFPLPPDSLPYVPPVRPALLCAQPRKGSL